MSAAEVPPPIKAAVDRVVASFRGRYPRYAADVHGAAWVRVIERRARGQAQTPEHAAVVARCGIVDFLRAEQRAGRFEGASTRHTVGYGEEGQGWREGAQVAPDESPAPASGPDFFALRQAFGRLDPADRATLVRVELDGPDSRSAQAWRRHKAAKGRARELWADA